MHLVNLFLHTTFPLFTIRVVENSKTGGQLPETSLNSHVSESSDGANCKLRVLRWEGVVAGTWGSGSDRLSSEVSADCSSRRATC